MDPETLIQLDTPFIRPSLAAFALGVSRSTVYRWFWEGKLTGIQLFGQAIRIHRHSVAQLLADSEV